jgi:hypothetical protein
MANDSCECFLHATTLAILSAMLHTLDYILAVPPERGTTQETGLDSKNHRDTLARDFAHRSYHLCPLPLWGC